MPQVVEFEFLSTADLIVDAIYEGKSQHASDPISKLLPGCGNMGGFRLTGKGQDKQFVSLFTTGQERDWPDRIDLNTGQFTYYGDNRTPGHELHETPLGGNRVLRRVFELLHSSPPQRELRHSLYSRNTRHRKVRVLFSSKGSASLAIRVSPQPRIWSLYGKPPEASVFRTIGRFSPSST